MNAFDLLSLSAFTSWRHVYHGVYGGFFSIFDGSNFLDIDPVWFSTCYSKQLNSKFSRFRRFVSDKCRRNNIPIWSTVVVLRYVNRELRQRRWRRQREPQKSNGFKLAKQQLYTCITLFCTFLCRHYTTTTWKCANSRFVEDLNTTGQRLSFSFLELWDSLLELNFRNNCQHLKNWPRWNKRDKVWRSANSLFNWRFRSCRRRCCVP